jgi:hypothetical protein
LYSAILVTVRQGGAKEADGLVNSTDSASVIAGTAPPSRRHTKKKGSVNRKSPRRLRNAKRTFTHTLGEEEIPVNLLCKLLMHRLIRVRRRVKLEWDPEMILADRTAIFVANLDLKEKEKMQGCLKDSPKIDWEM